MDRAQVVEVVDAVDGAGMDLLTTYPGQLPLRHVEGRLVLDSQEVLQD